MDVTAIIKTFERPDCADRLIRSIRKHYSEIPICLVDDSRDPPHREGIDIYLRPDHDTGLSIGRNLALRTIDTELFLILDDDFVFTRETRIDKMVSALHDHRVDIVGGMVDTIPLDDSVRNMRTGRDGRVSLHKIDQSKRLADGFIRCDFTHNFFIARTQRIRSMGGWDENAKVGEHFAFFYDALNFGITVGHTTASTILHRPINETPYYKKHRGRAYDFYRAALNRRGIKEVLRRGVEQ